MGVFSPFSKCSSNDIPFSTSAPAPTPSRRRQKLSSPNPNPRKFIIDHMAMIRKFLIVQVRYPDATNFEGKKILVFKDVTMDQVKTLKVLDPHFCDDKKHLSPIARFVPTQKGWAWAVHFCRTAHR